MPDNLAQYIEHTLLKSEASEKDIIELCREAKENKFYAVCINPCHVNLASKLLSGTQVKVVSVVGFPLGASLTAVKALEARYCFEAGADEIDMVMNIGALKQGKEDSVRADIKAVVEEAKKQILKKVVKVIIETCLLTDAEKVKACYCVVEAGADFVKTSTGLNIGGATVDDIRLMRKTVGAKAKIKASGGIRDLQAFLDMLQAGADKVGTSSGMKIIKEV